MVERAVRYHAHRRPHLRRRRAVRAPAAPGGRQGLTVSEELRADEEEICGEAYDHDEEIDYDGPDGLQWSCRRCGAEGWEARTTEQTGT